MGPMAEIRTATDTYSDITMAKMTNNIVGPPNRGSLVLRKMRRSVKPVLVRLDDWMYDVINRQAGEWGLSREGTIRALLSEALEVRRPGSECAPSIVAQRSRGRRCSIDAAASVGVEG